MLSVFATIWLLLQLPVGLALGRFLGCPQRASSKRTEARSPAITHTTAHAA